MFSVLSVFWTTEATELSFAGFASRLRAVFSRPLADIAKSAKPEPPTNSLAIGELSAFHSQITNRKSQIALIIHNS